GLRLMIRIRVVVVLLFVLLLAATYAMYRVVPTGFVPEADQGYVMVIIQAPQGASLDYTINIVHQVEDIIGKMPDTDRFFAAAGFGFSGSAPNQGIMFLSLKDWKQRPGPEHSAQAIV